MQTRKNMLQHPFKQAIGLDEVVLYCSGVDTERNLADNLNIGPSAEIFVRYIN